ncbi:hypothetical protein [Rhodocyclus tenuis]|uniref:Uncharacterized protein n=1 Tax=Rhodocyclus tenuis TaxID=1066 RepID=A0A840FWT3_RHOTE|nr:hypothetical protein [Rhodocyclus tenuis]MBB4246547.1 hypothetical protein [Rhodocyclus tenuis]
MAEDKKPSKPAVYPDRNKTHDKAVPLSDQRGHGWAVTNTMPAPPNPHRGGNGGNGGKGDKK